MLFEQTDFCCDLRRLEGRLSQLSGASIVEKAMAEVRYYYAGREVEFSAFQADFTPWNMFEEGGELFVFDWEYARLTYPPRLDYFHFRIQTSIFEQHLPADVICAGFEADGNRLNGIYGDYRFSLKCYLLAVMSLYVNREDNLLAKDTIKHIEFWINILRIME